jgi:hypothetical protein
MQAIVTTAGLRVGGGCFAHPSHLCHSTHLKSAAPAPSSGNHANANCGVKPRMDVDHTSSSCVGIQYPQQEDVMAAHSAVRAINSQEITEKARRDLLHLLEGVCKTYEDLSCQTQRLTSSRSEARRTLSLKRLLLELSASSSSSARFKNMVSTRSSS